MDVAYASEFVGDMTVFRAVDAPGFADLMKVGDARSLDEVYCGHILAGRLPELIPDTSLEPLAQSMPITHSVHIGSHISVPIRLSNGENYGMFCCLSAKPDLSLNERDHQAMRAFADLAAYEIERELDAARLSRDMRTRVQTVLDGRLFRIVYQPIFDIQHDRIVGFEALSRIDGQPPRSPDRWFEEANLSGLGVEFEVAAIEKAMEGMIAIPSDMYLTINASPKTMASPLLGKALERYPMDRLVLEITEQTEIIDYAALHQALRPLREAGARLAVDAAGAGYSSLRHISQLSADIIKCDITLTRGVDRDPVLQALMNALLGFANGSGSTMVAEGIETESELDCMRDLGVHFGQGYYLGRPAEFVDQEDRRIRA